MPRLNFFASNGMNPVTGYGKSEISLAHGLKAAGVDVWLCNQKVAPLADAPTLIVGNPGWGLGMPGSRRWLYTMSESTRVSQRWVDLMNDEYELVLLPCEGLVEVYQSSGVKTPIGVIGDGIDHFLPPYRRRTLPAGGEQFIFLTYSRGDMRKGAELALLAFNRIFRGDLRCRMVVKAPPSPHWLDGLQDEQITVVSGNIPEKDWHDLLGSAHAFVFPSRAEGFGLPPREATLAGLPTLATAWLGMADVDRWGYALPVKELRLATYEVWEANAEGGQWAEPESEAIDRWMLWIVTHYKEACDQAARGRDYLLANNSCRGIGLQIKALLEKDELEMGTFLAMKI